jgi:hypothetical protein
MAECLDEEGATGHFFSSLGFCRSFVIPPSSFVLLATCGVRISNRRAALSR